VSALRYHLALGMLVGLGVSAALVWRAIEWVDG
jgi:hypothetical protein